MYVGMNGSIIYASKYKIQDTFNINFTLDIKDIPFGKVGVTQNLSKSNRSAMEDSLRLILADMLNNNPSLANISIDGIMVDPNNLNKFVISANIDGNYINIPIGEDNR